MRQSAMSTQRIIRAVVLAAGMGSRLSEHDQTPKPLRPAGGVPLLVRVLRVLQDVGIREAVIVIGHQGDRLRRALLSEPSLGLELVFVENDRYTAKNGLSVLAAADYVDQECLLTMSDHLYSPELPRRLMAAELPEGVCALGVDRDVERCFDIDDATKVQTEGPYIRGIGKELAGYDAIDTGVFRITPALIDALRAVAERKGECSLSDGVQALAAAGAFYACDIGDARWIDVDTPQAMERAEAMLRVFGDRLGDEPEAGAPVSPEAIEAFAPTWVRAAKPYREDHFAIADGDGDILRMMSNESPFSPSPRVVRAILDAAMRTNLYPTSAKRLREQLAGRDGFEGANVLLGAGSTELIDVAIRTFVGPGEEVLLSVPTFSMYEARTRLVGGIPVLVPLRDDNETDIVGLIRAVTERTKLIFVCTPNNPTGNPISESDLRRLARLGLPIVVDEAYYELGDAPSFARLIREFPNLIVLRTFSKAHGLAGIRLGYLIGHASVVHLLSRVKIPWNIPAVSIAAASAVLEDVAEFESRLEELKAARMELCARLARIQRIGVLPSDGNFVLIDISASGMTAPQVVDAMLAEGVLIRSLEVHHATRHFVRVTVGTAAQNARCADALERVLRRGPARDVGKPFLSVSAVGGDAE